MEIDTVVPPPFRWQLERAKAAIKNKSCRLLLLWVMVQVENEPIVRERSDENQCFDGGHGPGDCLTIRQFRVYIYTYCKEFLIII